MMLSAALSVTIQLTLWNTLINSGFRNDIVLPEMAVYVVINIITLALTSSRFAGEFAGSVRDGSVINVFLRPASFQLSQLCVMLGGNVVRVIVTGAPALLIALLFSQFLLPPNLACGLLFIPLIACGVLITFSLFFLTGLFAFWLQKTWFLYFYMNAGIILFGGSTVPIWLYPRTLEAVSRALPFRYITFEAVNCYLGRGSLVTNISALAISVAWILILQLIIRLVWKRAQLKLDFNGG
jgi:ABC-2 type transport system permease protein